MGSQLVAARRWTARTAVTAVSAVVLALLPTPFGIATDEPEQGTYESIVATDEPTAQAAERSTAQADSGFGEKNRFVGRLGYSADGLGQRSPGGSVFAEVPAGATIRLAYLYGSYFGGSSPSVSQRTILFGGSSVLLTTIPSNTTSFLRAARADVTAQVTAAIGAGGTRTAFRVDNDPAGLDGVALLVVYEHASLPVSTIAVIDGGASQSGQRTTLEFASALDPGLPGFTARMSLGIGFGFQGGSASTPGSSICGTGANQSSIIDVNDRGLTSCAGNYDDGFGTNGALITVGGLDDSPANPADPFQRPRDGRLPRVQDDELYDLAPFITAGDDDLVIESINPSFDDIIFLTVISITARIETVTSVPIGQTFGSGGGTHGTNPTGYQADPVNSLTGFYVASAVDAVIPTRGPALRLDRTYNSGDDLASLLGRGWSSTWDTRLLVDTDDVTFVAEDGQRLRYERSGSALDPPPGANSMLTAVTGGYQLVRRDRTTYRFDTAGRLLSVRDRNGLGFTVERTADGRLAAVVDDAGRRTEFAVTAAGRLTGVTLPDGRTLGYTFDAGGRLAAFTDLEGRVTSYTYDAAGRLRTIVDPTGVTRITNTYDATGRVVEQVDATGGVSTFSWNEATLTSTMTDATGGQWRDVYDEDGKLVRRIDPLGNEVGYEWNGDLRLVAVTDPSGAVNRFTYDDDGDLVEIAGPASVGAVSRFTYDADHNLTSVTDPKGGVTTFTHDANGNLLAVTGPLGATAHIAYAGGLPVSITDRRGGVTAIEHDAHGGLVRTTTPDGAVSRVEYDPSGRVVAYVDPTGRRTELSYDLSGHVVEARDALGNVTRFGYDANGRRTSVTDANGHVRRFAYDAAGRLVTVTAPDGGTTRYAYDAAGRTTSRTDANGHVTAYTHDAAGRVTSVTLPTGESWHLAYDANGNAVTATTPRGEVRLGYDELDRLVGIDYGDATPDVTYTYDLNGNRTSMRDGLGLQSYGYDAENRLVSVLRGSDAFSYAYDANGNVVERAYPDGRRIGYQYTADGLLAAVTDGPRTTRYTYDAAGRPLRTTLPNGTTETRTYDAAGRLTGVRHAKPGGQAFDGWEAVLDPVGNPVVDRSFDGGREVTYEYDAADRIVEACSSASCPDISGGTNRITWTYDKAGNRLSESRPGTTTLYTYDASDRLLSAGPITYAYDANGNRTRAGAATYEYDLANRMVRAGVVDYTYDGDGLLRGAGGREHLWDVAAPAPLLALERGGAAAGLTATAAPPVGYTHGQDLISNGTAYLHQDRVGNVTTLTDATAQVRARYEYEPFGVVSRASGIDAGTAPRIGFAGMPRDPATGLTQLLARNYDPVTGTMLQRDPVAARAGVPASSAYGWVGNRPTVLSDPTGQCPWCILAGVGAVVGGIVGGAAYAITTDDFDWREFGGSVAGGALAGAITGVAGPLGGSVAASFGLASTGAVATGATIGISAAGGLAGSWVTAGVGYGRAPTAEEMLLASGSAALGGWVGSTVFPTVGMNTIAQVRYFAPRTWSSLVSGKTNISAIYNSALLGGLWELGIAVGYDNLTEALEPYQSSK